eukprot:TRINITY_DN1504_c0_g3_i1.p1 TRINITY_DN1504_c0_g3~~TRINITY_DN1504_c0_g3_i1.p1  ORF type:complete len:593 (-),score=260.92 TRINITY_DN1504_c0_g3_i1:118-1896(-)
MNKFINCLFIILFLSFFTNCFCFKETLNNEKFAKDPLTLVKLYGNFITGFQSTSKVSDNGGGTVCAGCTLIVSMVEQFASIYNETVDNVIAQLCNIFPSGIESICKSFIERFGPQIINRLELKETPDVVCNSIGLCTDPTCRLFPPPKSASWERRSGKSKQSFNENFKHSKRSEVNVPLDVDPIVKVFDNHQPLIDFDHDNFSTAPTLRGTHWRGADCQDLDNYIYPGRFINNYVADIDHNCNGIYGRDELKRSYEELYCTDTPPMGVAILGDSAAAHFHIPPEYIMPTIINSTTYSNVIEIAENEGDWPHMSSTTGFTNSSWIGHPIGPVSSIYLHMRERNRCMHRDYQNIGVNGARTSSMASNIMFSFARDQQNDNPVLLTYALIGNDVCNSHPDMSHMTTPDEFYDNVILALDYLDTKLPMGSHVVFLGLVDGRVLWDTMNARIHPIGIWRQDVTYTNLYDYLNCLQISPCFGWMNSNETWRNLTTERAMELNQVYTEIINERTYKHFDMTYFDTPIQEIIDEYAEMGGEIWQLIEPVDGFHPSQIANALLADYIWNEISTPPYSYLVPPVNPHNSKIDQIFGDQGGYE